MRVKQVPFVFLAVTLVATAVAVAQEQRNDDQASLATLRQQREQVLRELVDFARTSYEQGLTSLDSVIAAETKLLEAQLEGATTARGRIGIRESQLELATKREKEVAKLVEQGNVSSSDLMRAKAKRLNAEIALVREKQGREAPSTHSGNASDSLPGKIEIAEIRAAMRLQEVEIAKEERRSVFRGFEGTERMLQSVRQKLAATEKRVAHLKNMNQQGLTSLATIQQAESERFAVEAEVAACEATLAAQQHKFAMTEARIKLLELQADLAKKRLDQLRADWQRLQ